MSSHPAQMKSMPAPPSSPIALSHVFPLHFLSYSLIARSTLSSVCLSLSVTLPQFKSSFCFHLRILCFLCDKVSMLSHSYPHKALMKLKLSSAVVRLTVNFIMCDLMFDLVVCNPGLQSEKGMMLYMMLNVPSEARHQYKSQLNSNPLCVPLSHSAPPLSSRSDFCLSTQQLNTTWF